MTRYKFLVGTAVVAFALSVTPVWAQGRPGEGGGGGGGGGEGRPGGGGGVGGGSASGPSNAGSGGGGGSSSGGGGSASSAPSSGGSSPSFDAPSRPSNRDNQGVRSETPQRRGGSGAATTGQRAVPRGSSAETRGSSRVPSATPSTGGSDRAEASVERSNPSDRAVPAYSRPRDGRQVVGQAVERTDRPGRPIGGYYPVRPGYPYYPYYGYGSYYWPSFGFGFGYYYDPFMYDPFYYSGGYGYGGYSSGSASYGRRDTGALRLKIKPRQAQVFVDGYFVGTIDSFDGMFQKLGIDGGGHRIEIKADGYEPLQFEVLVTPGETVTYKGELKRIQ